MKVQIEKIGDHSGEGFFTADLPAVPRVGESVEVNGESWGTVHAVLWDIPRNANSIDELLIVVRCR